jgi:AAA+ superfamily predicted ATPase
VAIAPTAEIRVVDVADRSRFEVRVEGDVAGHTEYLDLVPEDMRAKFDLPAHG